MVTNNANPPSAQELGGLGNAEVISVAVASGQTSVAVHFKRHHTVLPIVLASPNYAANAFVTAITKTGCTLNFTDPAANKVIELLIVG